jgi:hypothetical protein
MDTGKPTKEKYIRINNRDIEIINNFKYLVFITSSSSSSSTTTTTTTTTRGGFWPSLQGYSTPFYFQSTPSSSSP